ncbi:alpha/beta hydrolase [Catenuloplanes atrovinosus]|uniref:Pimeloyl-ACP methyl ester carboxylesterase n=1 Tax=Catenuloplanes atrovinosus TaxID=137266 RepID=A0AAE4CA73_9ACTN|nr:alpha/beta hydrolase [Catenuloplanes atrovinosus]MDR7275549.1 pimeloyl-ACP methyl ester carboxylesterase [Catenuloplanes atrovinosus]
MIRRTTVGGAAGALLLAVLAAPVSAGPPPLRWTPCADGFECATVPVPLDHDDPAGPRISIALTRMPATDPDRRIGSLVINPGGPGLSGVSFVQTYLRDLPAELRARFDIVGFDSRGLGASTALRCYATAEEQRADQAPFLYPETPAEEEVWRRADDRLAAACDRRGHPIIDHMSSADVARDLDLLRVRLGDRKLTFLGYSFGSILGQTYANLFPRTVRALVIDGVIDPVTATRPGPAGHTTPTATRMGSGRDATRTLEEFFRVCDAAGAACAFSGDASGRFARLAERVRRAPVPITDPFTGAPVVLTYNDLIGVALWGTWNAARWPDLARYLAGVEHQLFPSGRRAPPAPEAYPNQFEGEFGVACSDTVNPRSFRAWRDAADRAEREQGYFGRIYAWVWSACRSWPPSAGQDRYDGPWTARTAAPVLIVGNHFDPATPYAGALAAARLLPNSRLLTFAGWGHVAFHLQGNDCVDAHVTRYLIDATPPAPGTVCRPDPPFPPSGAR